jgi:DMSO/TMAO reductase YedYZ molybdopterin-dependent catalytic subunit
MTKPRPTPGERLVGGHAAERLGIDRRRFLAASGSALAALALGCDSNGPASAKGILADAERWNERVERSLLRHGATDVPRASARSAGASFPSYFVAKTVPVWNEGQRGVWSLEVSGMVDHPLTLTLADLVKMPSLSYRLDHYCVEGWNAVATRTGVRLSDLARLVGVRPDAQYVDFQSFDLDAQSGAAYHESWDLDSAMHPQTLVVYGQDGRYLNPAWGAPARIYSPVKLGYKNTKYLTRIQFMPVRNGGYWTDVGYEWYGGT